MAILFIIVFTVEIVFKHKVSALLYFTILHFGHPYFFLKVMSIVADRKNGALLLHGNSASNLELYLFMISPHAEKMILESTYYDYVMLFILEYYNVLYVVMILFGDANTKMIITCQHCRHGNCNEFMFNLSTS